MFDCILQKIVFSILTVLVFGYIASTVYAFVTTTATVPAWQSCEIRGFDLHCQTNAQHVYINGQMLD